MANETIVGERTFNLRRVSLSDARNESYNAVVSISGSSKRLDFAEVAAIADIAPAFSTESDYSMGNLVFHEGSLYRAKEPVDAGAFNSEKWETITLHDAIPPFIMGAGDDDHFVNALNIVKNSDIARISARRFGEASENVECIGLSNDAIKIANAGKALVIKSDGSGVELVAIAPKSEVDDIKDEIGNVETLLAAL